VNWRQKTMARLKRDDNFVPITGGISSSDADAVLPLKIDPVTGRLLVSGVINAEYTEGDTDTSFTGIISMAEYSNTAKPLQVDSSGNLKVNILGWEIPAYDYIALTYVASGNGVGEIETITYKTGGSGGTTVATLTLAYNADNKISSITKS